MNYNKIKRKKFISYSLLFGSTFFLFNKIPFIKTDKKFSTKKNITLKQNPLSVIRQKSGEKNV